MLILGISGSLRKASYNTSLLRAALDDLPEGVEMHIMTCDQIPLYNNDLYTDQKPDPVRRLRGAIESADALLFATPEYNHSIPGVLKNAIDWASRPARVSPMAYKPAGILSASISFVGGARVHTHLRQVLDSTLTPVFPAQEFLVGTAQNKVDASGRLNDRETLALLRQYLQGFVQWVGRQARPEG